MGLIILGALQAKVFQGMSRGHYVCKNDINTEHIKDF